MLTTTYCNFNGAVKVHIVVYMPSTIKSYFAQSSDTQWRSLDLQTNTLENCPYKKKEIKQHILWHVQGDHHPLTTHKLNKDKWNKQV